MMEKFYLTAHVQEFKVLLGFKFLYVLVFLPIFSFATSSPNDNIEPPTQFSRVVYVSNSAKIYDADQMLIVIENDLSGKSIVSIAKPTVKPVAISKDAIEQEKKIKEEKFEKEFPTVKAEAFVHNSSTDSSLLAAKQIVNCQATITTPSPQKQVLNATIGDGVKPNSIDSHLVKQKYYTSLCYLLFGKYRSASLRAPPAFS